MCIPLENQLTVFDHFCPLLVIMTFSVLFSFIVYPLHCVLSLRLETHALRNNVYFVSVLFGVIFIFIIIVVVGAAAAAVTSGIFGSDEYETSTQRALHSPFNR